MAAEPKTVVEKEQQAKDIAALEKEQGDVAADMAPKVPAEMEVSEEKK
jgi:hypothetical protein